MAGRRRKARRTNCGTFMINVLEKCRRRILFGSVGDIFFIVKMFGIEKIMRLIYKSFPQFLKISLKLIYCLENSPLTRSI
mgnify:CR=1 FL=1